MIRHNVVCAVGIALATCGGDGEGGAGSTSGGESSGSSGGGVPDPFSDPSQPGPWAVGVKTLELQDPARARTFAVDVWYPVDPAAPDGAPNEYVLELPIGEPVVVATPARRDATAAIGMWPAVVFSHGFGGVRFQSYYLTEHLASHGFTVVAPDHPGNTIMDFAMLDDDAATAQSAVDRPLDVVFVLDWMLGGGAGVAVDPARVAASGHSFGGWTALETAHRDARIAVVVALAPGFQNRATPDFVAELARPLVLFGGSEDSTTPFATDQQLPYELAQPPKALVQIVGAGHLDFSNLCEVPLLAGFADDGCDPSLIEPAEVHARVRTIGTAFLRRELDADAAYDAFLTSAYVEGLGQVVYSHDP